MGYTGLFWQARVFKRNIMLNQRIIFAALALNCLLCARSAEAAAPGMPTNVRVIDSFSQMGIDSTNPRFGWVVNDADRADRQSAYQIIVATSEANIDGNVGSAWDSGIVATNIQYGVTYAGTPLLPAAKYWFKIRTWDKDNQVSAWSPKTNFVTGFFQAGDWAAGIQWIKHPAATTGGTTANPPAMFRKEFQITKPVKQAYFFVSGLGQFVASLNGAKVGDHELDPDWTDYDKTVCYVPFDVTSQIQQGGNALGVMLGHGWYAYPGTSTRDFGPLKVWGQLHVDFTDGTFTNIVTDTSWKAATSPWTYTEVHGAETYDARLEQAGWNLKGFDAAPWFDAVSATPPSGKLVAQSAPPTKVIQVYQPVKITNPSANIYVYDFGQNMNGQYEITVSGTAGMSVFILPGEYLKSNGRPPAQGNNSNRAGAGNYTLKGGGPETWRLSFSSTGFRYLEVRGVTTNSADTVYPYVSNITAYRLSSAASDVGTFTASDARYNQIHDLARYTLENNVCSIHTDGPNFERLGWQEVVWTTPPSTAYQHDVQTLLAKILRDIRDAQRTVGLCPDIAPNWFHPSTDAPSGKYDDAPAWGASAFITPWIVYSTYGDLKILQDNYVTMTNYLAYLKSNEVNGLVTYGLGDWMAPAGSPVAIVEGAVYVYDTKLMRDTASVLGKTNDAVFYTSEFTRVCNAYNGAYFNTNTQSYAPMNQANQAIPLVFGIVPSNSVAAVQQALVNDIINPQENGSPPSYGSVGDYGPVLPYHVTAGDVGVTPLWRALGDAGQHDLVQTMIMQPTAPSYMNLINSGETTITENWNLAKTRSHDHDMYAGIFEWLFRSLGGISSLKPGYEQIQLKPGLPAGLTNVVCTYNSVRGNINSSWNVDNNQLMTWNVQVPVNVTAKLFIPVPGTATNTLAISESGSLIWTNNTASGNVAGVTFDHVESGYVVWNVGSGTYQFQRRITPAPTGLRATPGSGQIFLNWSPVPGATGYNLKRAMTSAGPFTNIGSGLTVTNYADNTVANGVAYYYVVSAVFPGNESANSSSVNAAIFLEADLLLYHDTFGRGSVASPLALSNTMPDVVNGLNGIWKATNSFSTDGAKANYVNATATSALMASLPVAALTPGLSYKISADLTPTSSSDATTWMGIAFVSAYNTSSVFSNPVAFLLARKNGNGQTFYGNPGLNNGSGDVAGTGGTNTFSIMLALDSTGSAMVIFSTNGTAFRTGTLTSNQVALIQGLGIAGNGNGSVDNFKFLVSPPATPANLTALAGDGRAVLNWSASSGAIGYKLKRSTTNGGPYGILITNASTAFTDAGLSNGTHYYYVVSALGAPGESLDSGEASVLPVAGTSPPISWQIFPNQLKLIWPSTHLGWQLQSQTNGPNQGLGNHWVVVANSDISNQLTVPTAANNGSVFFRLIHP